MSQTSLGNWLFWNIPSLDIDHWSDFGPWSEIGYSYVPFSESLCECLQMVVIWVQSWIMTVRSSAFFPSITNKSLLLITFCL